MQQNYEKTAELLATQGVSKTPAEVHGIICGQLSSGAEPYDRRVTSGLAGFGDPPPAVLEELCQRFADSMTQDLLDGAFTFSPLLPDDDEELHLRAFALGRWCDGFVMGFAAGFNGDESAMGEETREVLGDFAKIAELEHRVDEGDAEEESYTEIVEYVRMAATAVCLQNRDLELDAEGPKDEDILH